MKIDILKVDGDILTWKQVEHRNGLTFMRMKKIERQVWFKNGQAC